MSCLPLIVTTAWLHPVWEVTVLRRFSWLYEVKKKDEEKRIEVEHEKLFSSMIRSAEGGTGQRRREEECRF